MQNTKKYFFRKTNKLILDNSIFKFSSKTNAVFSERDASSRIKNSIKPKTINDIKKIQNFVKTSNASGELEESVYRTAKRNEEFNLFFKDFKEKNRGKWASIINAVDVDDSVLQETTDQDKKEEIEMLEEFERRRKFKNVYEAVNENEELKKEKDKKEQRKKELRQSERVEDILKADPDKGEIFDSTKFTLMFLDAGMTCNMTRLNRVYQRRILLYMGNKQGLISYGIGRAALYQEAFTNAYKELRKNLIAIECDLEFTLPGDLVARFNDYRLYLSSRYVPKMYGNPLMALMLRYAGLYHAYFIIKSRNKEPYAMVFAFFKAVTRNHTPNQVCEIIGTKPYRHYIGRPMKFEHNLGDIPNN